MLQNARVTTFTVFELLRENQQECKILPPPTKVTVKCQEKVLYIKKTFDNIQTEINGTKYSQVNNVKFV